MPRVEHDGRAIRYETDGPEDAPTVVFTGDVGYGAWLWGWQAPTLAGPWRTLVWDLPGTGESEPPPAGVTVADLAEALEAVLADAGVRRAHLVGAGLGGMVALAFAHGTTSDGSRARSLSLFCTANDGAAIDADELWGLTMETDDPGRCEASLAGALSEDYRDARPDLVEQICAWRRTEDATGEAVERQANAARSFAGVPLHEVTRPALVLAGETDPMVPPGAARALAEGLPRGRFEAVAGRHCCYVEHSRAVTDRLEAFLDEVTSEQE